MKIIYLIWVFMVLNSSLLGRDWSLILPSCDAPFDSQEEAVFRLIKSKAKPNFLLIIKAGTNGWEWVLINDLEGVPFFYYGFDKDGLYAEMGRGELNKKLVADAIEIRGGLRVPIPYGDISVKKFINAGDATFLLTSNLRFQTQLWRSENTAAAAARRIFTEIRSVVEIPKPLLQELPSLEMNP